MQPDGVSEREGLEGEFRLRENLREQDDPVFYASIDPHQAEYYQKHVVLTSPENGLVSSAALEGPVDGPRGRRAVDRLVTAIRENGEPDPEHEGYVKYSFTADTGKIDMSLDKLGLVTLKPDQQLGGGEIVMHNGDNPGGANKKEFGVIWINGYMKGENFPGRDGAISKVESLLGKTLANLPAPKIH